MPYQITNEQSITRAVMFGRAFDSFLIELLAELHPEVEPRLNTTFVANLAVRANAMHCGPIARKVESYLLTNGVCDVSFHSLHEHYVVKDLATNLLYDLEAYSGVRQKEDLPLYQRGGGCEVSSGAEHAWMIQREKAVSFSNKP
jgi:hypothetical protein